VIKSTFISNVAADWHELVILQCIHQPMQPSTAHVSEQLDLLSKMVPASYSEGPVFRKATVQIHATVLTFVLRIELRSALGLNLRLAKKVDFRNSGRSK